MQRTDIRDLVFARVDLAQVGQLATRSLRVVPSSSGSLGAVVVGDESGCLLCFTMKNGDPLVCCFFIYFCLKL